MKYLKKFESNNINFFQILGIDENVVNNLTDICTSIDDDYYLNIRLIIKDEVYDESVNVYESGKWTIDNNMITLYDTFDILKLKIESVAFDIYTDNRNSDELIRRIKSEYDIVLVEGSPELVSIYNLSMSKIWIDSTGYDRISFTII